MRWFLIIATVAMLIAHAVLGCCSHHVHACGQTHGPIVVLDGKNDCSAACGGQFAGTCGQTGSEHQGRDDCQGIRCDSGRLTPEREAGSSDVFCQPAVLLLSEAVPASVDGQLEHVLGTVGILWPVRLHLVNQVLLI